MTKELRERQSFPDTVRAAGAVSGREMSVSVLEAEQFVPQRDEYADSWSSSNTCMEKKTFLFIFLAGATLPSLWVDL